MATLIKPSPLNAQRFNATELRIYANYYLPRRLYQLALRYGFKINPSQVRINHAHTRWGSRSTTGTISLNLMLMAIPPELCDYVILHELNHIKHMNHGKQFWDDLELICPGALERRKLLRAYSPY